MRKKTLDPELYKKIGIGELIIFSVNSAAEKKEKCTFERLLEECFNLFPKAVCFSKNQKWPDSRKLDRPLRDLRKKNFIKGDPKNSFVLTKEGKKITEETAKIFCQRKLKI